MRRVALLAALLVGAAVAAAAAGSPRKLLDASQDNVAQQMRDKADNQVQEQLGKLQIPAQLGGVGGSGGSSLQQPQALGATGPIANPSHPINPGQPGNAVESTPGSNTNTEATGFDLSKLGLGAAAPVPVQSIPGLISGLPPISATNLPSAMASVEGSAAAQAGNSIASTWIKASVKNGVANALAGGFVQAGCQGGTNFALSISLGTAAVVAGRAFVNDFNQALARQFPSSHCSSCYTRTLNQANTVAQSLGGGDGVSSASSIGFALGVCMP